MLAIARPPNDAEDRQKPAAEGFRIAQSSSFIKAQKRLAILLTNKATASAEPGRAHGLPTKAARFEGINSFQKEKRFQALASVRETFLNLEGRRGLQQPAEAPWVPFPCSGKHFAEKIIFIKIK